MAKAPRKLAHGDRVRRTSTAATGVLIDVYAAGAATPARFGVREDQARDRMTMWDADDTERTDP